MEYYQTEDKNKFEQVMRSSEKKANGILFVKEAYCDSCLNIDVEEIQDGLLEIYGYEHMCMISHLEDINKCS